MQQMQNPHQLMLLFFFSRFLTFTMFTSGRNPAQRTPTSHTQRLDDHPSGRHPFGRHLGTQLRDDAQRDGAQRGGCPAAEGGCTSTPLPATPLGVLSELGPEMTPKGVAPKGGPKPYKFIGFGDIHGPKPYKFVGFGDPSGSVFTLCLPAVLAASTAGSLRTRMPRR